MALAVAWLMHDSSALTAYNVFSLLSGPLPKACFVQSLGRTARRDWKLPEFDTESACGGTADLRRKRRQGRI
jgi:hypothetical protein